MTSNNVLRLPNQHLQSLTNDYLFHFDISLGDPKTVSIFKDVKFMCVGGTASRMELLALDICNALQYRVGQEDRFDFQKSTERYSVYKAGPVLCVNHGIGAPSANIVLQEMFKLLQKAGASDVTLLRIGTCGGLGVPPGSLAITTGVLTSGFQPIFRTSSLGKQLELPVVVDQDLANEIFSLASCEQNGVTVVKGKTYCTEGFYEAQGRIDGAFCDYSREERNEFLQRLQKAGVVNLEMESACILALSHRAGIRAAVVCGILVDRMEVDLPDMTKCQNVQTNLLQLISGYIKYKLEK